MLEIDTVVLDADQLMNHRLVGPLIKQRCDRILLTVHDEQVRREGVSRHPIDEFTLLVHLRLRLLGYVATQGAVAFIADDRVCSCGHQQAKEAIDNPVCCQMVLLTPIVGCVKAQ